MVFEEDPQKEKKWTQQATTSAFGLMESLRGQGSSLAKNLKNFGKSLVKEHKSQGPTTPPEHRDDDIRLTWLTNRLVLADTLHNSKDGLLKAETAVVREMIDCQPYVVVNVHAEPLKLDGYAKSLHVPMGTTTKGGVPKYPSIQSLIPILNEYCLLTNDAAIVIFGSDENVQITAAFCLIASRSISRCSDFMRDSLPNRFDRLPNTYHLFLEQTKHICKLHTRRQALQTGAIISQIILEPGTLLIDGDLYVAVQQGANQLKVLEYSASSCRNRQGQLVFGMESAETVDDVVIFIGKKSDVKHPILAAKFNTQLLESDDNSIVLTSSEIDISKVVASAMPIQDLRMIINFATRRMPTLNAFQFDRYKLLCVRNERELDGYQRSYGDLDSEDESPILRSSRSKSGTKATEASSSSGNFFDSLQFADSNEPSHHREQRESALLDSHEDSAHQAADLLDGFTLGGNDELSPANETPILSAPTPASSDYDSMTSSQYRKNPSPAPAIDDLLGLGSVSNEAPSLIQSVPKDSSSGANLVDFDFGAPIKPTSSANNLNTASSATSSWSNSDLLGGFTPLKPQTTTTPPNTRNPSAANSKPVSQVSSQADFEAFLSNYPEKQQTPPSTQPPPYTQNTSQKPQQTRRKNKKKFRIFYMKFSAQNTYKPAFGEVPGTTKVSMDAFSDLLNQGVRIRVTFIY
ncbi:CBN-DNJ-25 protein [Caenorhabditis brenneri]|uniref:CBN-DNJ-25 protein n=1 Tax=Caenorhabditis brenneri TaxID=135651 RepID=G0NKL8_CAEBE|nr:CBN-DNJ-25 protein [Caenorhabditis brenneri]